MTRASSGSWSKA